jgi:type I restriction enzyme, S subunit
MALTPIGWDGKYMALLMPLLAASLQLQARSLIPGIAREDVESFVIALPPLAEQARIVAKVDELMAVCDQLEAALTAGESTSSRLLDALLHEALEPPVSSAA